ncbi:MAG: lysylphosphatidylglycerol synthase transmembrane domain-containing protein [Chloroflexota bacterium]|nr:lysylphosphatidylglycerol synthase transmembrane domain-containing protein [Chloroflexota bacterium]
MKSEMKRWLIWIGLIISGLFLYLTFRQINFTDLWATLQETRLWWLLPGLAIYFCGMLVRIWRWQYLLNPIKKVATKTLLPIIFIGYMGNNVFPFRMGEVLRTVVLKRREDVSISASLATIVIERIFDAVIIIGFVLLNLGQLSGLSNDSAFSRLGGLASWAAVIFGVGLAVFIVIALFPTPAMTFIHRVINKIIPQRWREGAGTIADRFLDGLMSLRSPKDALMVFLTSVLIWMFETGLYWSVSLALGLGLNFGQLMLLNGVVNLVLLIPAAPGGLGTFDAACRAMLQAYHVAPEPALGYTLILRIALWVPITLVGAIFFVREGLKWTIDIHAMQAQVEIQSPSTIKGDQNEK